MKKMISGLLFASLIGFSTVDSQALDNAHSSGNRVVTNLMAGLGSALLAVGLAGKRVSLSLTGVALLAPLVSAYIDYCLSIRKAQKESLRFLSQKDKALLWDIACQRLGEDFLKSFLILVVCPPGSRSATQN